MNYSMGIEGNRDKNPENTYHMPSGATRYILWNPYYGPHTCTWNKLIPITPSYHGCNMDNTRGMDNNMNG